MVCNPSLFAITAESFEPYLAPQTMVISKMQPLAKKLNYQFDFEIGYLVKSPCLQCLHREVLPYCAEACSVLEKIHALLAEAVSCTRRA